MPRVFYSKHPGCVPPVNETMVLISAIKRKLYTAEVCKEGEILLLNVPVRVGKGGVSFKR